MTEAVGPCGCGCARHSEELESLYHYQKTNRQLQLIDHIYCSTGLLVAWCESTGAFVSHPETLVKGQTISSQLLLEIAQERYVKTVR